MCEVPKCRCDDTEVHYLGKDVCYKHWEQHCNGKIDLKKVLFKGEKQECQTTLKG